MKIMQLATVDMSHELLLGSLIDEMVRRGHEVVAVSAPGPYVRRIEQRGARHRALASSTRRFDLLADLRSAREFWKVLREERPDVLHTHTPKASFYGRVLGRLAGVPAVVNTVHGLYATETDSFWKRALVYAVEGVGGHCSHAELVHNPEDAATMRRFHLAPVARVHTLGSGVDLAPFDMVDRSEARRALRDLWGVSDDEVLIGTVGRLVREKGIPELVEATRGMQGARLVVVGGADPEKTDGLTDSFVASACSDGVIFTGFRSDLAQIYSALDVFVLASHREGFPRVAMEAAAAGLPIVATDIRGCRQVVVEGVNGTLVPVGSVEALHAAILALVRDPSRRADWGRASFRRAREEFDERAVIERILHSYDEALQDSVSGSITSRRAR